MVRRWRRRVLLILLVAIALTIVVWGSLPFLVVTLARRQLPLAVSDSLTITRVGTKPEDLTPLGIARVMMMASPDRISTVATKLGRPIPAWLLHDGMCLQTAWNDAKHAPELPVELVALVRRDADPPLLVAAIPSEPLALLIARTAEPVHMGGNVLRWTYRLDPGSVIAHEGPPVTMATGVRRRFRAEAAGLVSGTLNGAICEVRVTRLTGYLDLDADHREDGWHLHGFANVETLESHIERCTSPVLKQMAGNLEGVLEMLLNLNVLSEHARRKDVLPSWFPSDLEFQAMVVAEPADCAAAVAGLAVPR